jgi:hypothetical protein
VRTIKVSTKDLVFALSRRAPDINHYLDTDTGEVMPVFSFNRDAILAQVKAEPDRFVRLAPLSGGQLFEAMKTFATTVSRPDLHARLEAALKEDAEAGRFRETLEAFPAEQKRWHQYRIELMVRSLRGRLLAKDIELVLLDDGDPA